MNLEIKIDLLVYIFPIYCQQASVFELSQGKLISFGFAKIENITFGYKPHFYNKCSYLLIFNFIFIFIVIFMNIVAFIASKIRDFNIVQMYYQNKAKR